MKTIMFDKLLLKRAFDEEIKEAVLVEDFESIKHYMENCSGSRSELGLKALTKTEKIKTRGKVHPICVGVTKGDTILTLKNMNKLLKEGDVLVNKAGTKLIREHNHTRIEGLFRSIREEGYSDYVNKFLDTKKEKIVPSKLEITIKEDGEYKTLRLKCKAECRKLYIKEEYIKIFGLSKDQIEDGIQVRK